MSRLPLCTAEEFNAAVQSARDAFPKWRATPVPQRARVMLKLQVGARRRTASWAADNPCCRHGGWPLWLVIALTGIEAYRHAERLHAPACLDTTCTSTPALSMPPTPPPAPPPSAGADPPAQGRAGGERHAGAGQDAGRRARRRLPRPGCAPALAFPLVCLGLGWPWPLPGPGFQPWAAVQLV